MKNVRIGKGKKIRLDKFLVEAGIGSRTEVKQLLRKEQVPVNSEVEISPKTQIDEKADRISCQGQTFSYEKYVYYMLNEPKGVISATEDNYHKTVLNLLDKTAWDKEVFPVGRSDINTYGLLLLTNNGKLAHAMLSPKKHVDKIYRAKAVGLMTTADMAAFANGIDLKDFTCQPAWLMILEINKAERTSVVGITIKGGKLHQVKRMVQACGEKVTDLQHLSMVPLQLDKQLALGEWRRLTDGKLISLEEFDVEL